MEALSTLHRAKHWRGSKRNARLSCSPLRASNSTEEMIRTIAAAIPQIRAEKEIPAASAIRGPTGQLANSGEGKPALMGKWAVFNREGGKV